MADELALCPETLVVAHGTAADALLRFAENREASSLLLPDAPPPLWPGEVWRAA